MTLFQRSPRHRWIVLAAAVAALAGPVQAAEPSEFSQAEKLVFVNPQLANVKSPAQLRYTFVKSGPMEPGFEDSIQIDVTPGKEGKATVHGDFLTGERRVQLPDIPDADANPVILFFLERDIREMERLTKGKSGYFRKRIRLTMVDAAQVRDTTVKFGGRDLPAQEVTLAPYESDPMRNRFEKYALKRYTFVLSNGVPGGVYQIRTSLPGALPSDAPMMEEVMTLASADALKASPTKTNNNSPKP